jgi:glucokinase
LDTQGRLTALNLGLKDFPLLDEFQRFAALHGLGGTPVFLEPDKRCAFLAECSANRGRDTENSLLVLIERGIGVGISIEGQLIEGWGGIAGEIGHVTVDPNAPDLCACGKRGCLEAIASTPNIVRQYLERSGGDDQSGGVMKAAHVWEKARRGDRIAREVIDRAGRALGFALSHAVSLLNPRTIILAGDVAGGEDLLIPPIREEMARHLLPALFDSLKFTVSSLGTDARLVGAAALAFRDSVAQSRLLKDLCCGSSLISPQELEPATEETWTRPGRC